MKKLSCLLICCLAHTAYGAPSASHTFTGFYLTGAIGGTSAEFDVSPEMTSLDFFPVTTPGDYTMYDISAAGSLGLGYLYQIGQHFVIGAEATAGYMDAQQNHDTSFLETIPLIPLVIDVDSNVEAQVTNDFALLLKMGIISRKSTLFYVLLGPRWGNFETTRSNSVLFSTGSTPGHADGSVSTSGYELGLTAGAGIQQMLTDHVHLSLEYDYTTYGNIDSPEFSSPAFFGTVPLGQNFTDTTKIMARTNTVKAAVSYQW